MTTVVKGTGVRAGIYGYTTVAGKTGTGQQVVERKPTNGGNSVCGSFCGIVNRQV